MPSGTALDLGDPERPVDETAVWTAMLIAAAGRVLTRLAGGTPARASNGPRRWLEHLGQRVHLNVTKELLGSQQVGRWVRETLGAAFALDPGDPASFDRTMSAIGRIRFTFEIDPEEPEVVHHPAARAFLAEVDRQIPHFPLFLDADPRWGQDYVWLGDLAPPDAWGPQGGLDLRHPAVEAVVERSARAIRALGHSTGLDLDVAAMNLFRRLL